MIQGKGNFNYTYLTQHIYFWQILTQQFIKTKTHNINIYVLGTGDWTLAHPVIHLNKK
jgi:hypothetical protein